MSESLASSKLQIFIKHVDGSTTFVTVVENNAAYAAYTYTHRGELKLGETFISVPVSS